MSAVIPAEFRDLLARDKRAFAHLALVLQDGTPHVSPIWFDWDGKHVILNTARGRVKDKVMSRLPRVALSITDPADWERYILIRGRVAASTEEGAWEQICDLREKYHGDRNFRRTPGQVRVTYKIEPEHVFASD